MTDDKAPKIPATDQSISPAARSILVADNRIDSRDIFLASREITIVHGGAQYRLRLTGQNKLILTK